MLKGGTLYTWLDDMTTQEEHMQVPRIRTNIFFFKTDRKAIANISNLDCFSTLKELLLEASAIEYSSVS